MDRRLVPHLIGCKPQLFQHEGLQPQDRCQTLALNHLAQQALGLGDEASGAGGADVQLARKIAVQVAGGHPAVRRNFGEGGLAEAVFPEAFDGAA